MRKMPAVTGECGLSKSQSAQAQETLSVQLSHAWSQAAAMFDDANLVSFAGLVPVLALAERAGLSELITERVRIDPAATRVRSGGVNEVVPGLVEVEVAVPRLMPALR